MREYSSTSRHLIGSDGSKSLRKGIKIAVVVQGQYYGQRTRHICEYLLDNNLESLVIFSSWKDFDIRDFSYIAEKYPSRFFVRQSERPVNPGRQNRYLQRYSTWMGILQAELLDCTHIFKVRSDQLPRKSEVCKFLLSSLDEYGDDRFVIGNAGTGSRGPPGSHMNVSDFWMFGKIENMKLWYSSDGIDMSAPDIGDDTVETAHTKLWMERKGVTYCSLDDLLAKWFVIIDNQDIDLVHKSLQLDVPWKYVEEFWIRYVNPDAPTHASWKRLLDQTTVHGI